MARLNDVDGLVLAGCVLVALGCFLVGVFPVLGITPLFCGVFAWFLATSPGLRARAARGLRRP